MEWIVVYKNTPPLPFFMQIGPKLQKLVIWVGGWGGLNVPTAIPYADILLLTLKYTSPPSFIQIGQKLPKFDIWGGFWVGGVGGWGEINMDSTPHVFFFKCIPEK